MAIAIPYFCKLGTHIHILVLWCNNAHRATGLPVLIQGYIHAQAYEGTFDVPALLWYALPRYMYTCALYGAVICIVSALYSVCMWTGYEVGVLIHA